MNNDIIALAISAAITFLGAQYIIVFMLLLLGEIVKKRTFLLHLIPFFWVSVFWRDFAEKYRRLD